MCGRGAHFINIRPLQLRCARVQLEAICFEGNRTLGAPQVKRPRRGGAPCTSEGVRYATPGRVHASDRRSFSMIAPGSARQPPQWTATEAFCPALTSSACMIPTMSDGELVLFTPCCTSAEKGEMRWSMGKDHTRPRTARSTLRNLRHTWCMDSAVH